MNRLQCQNFFEKLHTLFQPFHRVVLQTADHETVYLKYETLTDIGTLPQSAEISHRYLQIQDGDIVLTNDPYSGGTILTSPTLVMGVGTRVTKAGTPAEFLIASRLTFVPRVGAFKNVDDEGLRIPPSPLFVKGEINSPIVEALRAHPRTPKLFTDVIQTEAEKLLRFRIKLKECIVNGHLDLSKPNIKSYLNHTQGAFTSRLEEIGHGSQDLEMDISDSETIKLKAEHQDNHFTFDFSGTSAGSNLFMTDSSTIGVVIGSTMAWIGEDIPVNSGLFSRFDVRAPRGCLLNSAFPRPVYLGHTEGTNFLANVVVQALNGLDRKKAWASSGPSHVSYEIEFSRGRVYADSLPIGVGATHKGPGADGIILWRRLPWPQSLEERETEYPVQFLNIGFRSNSAGEGLHVGGRGVVHSIKVLEPGKLRWLHITPPHKPEGVQGGRSALGPEMILLKSTGEKVELPAVGEQALERGDVLTVLSPGGGGYGAKG